MIRQSVDRAKVLSKNTAKVFRGLRQYLAGGEPDTDSWRALLDLHCMTNGRSTDIMTRVMRTVRPPKLSGAPYESLLGSFAPKKVNEIVEDIRRDGYCVFKGRVPADICDGITAASLRLEARAGRKTDSKMMVFDPKSPIAPVYDVPERESIKIAEMQRLVADPIFANVAETYFRARSTIMNAALWWSPVMDGKPDTDAAQLFHFDYDPAPIWLKFFVYLTDVTPTTGPHVFVRGSHRRQLPISKGLLARHYVRIPDDEIEAVYGKENIIDLTGPRGTVIAVDTLGFHKGKPPTTGNRLLAQIVLATPLFVKLNAGTVPLPVDIVSELEEALTQRPWVYERYRASHPE